MPTLLRIDDHIRTIGDVPDEHVEFLRDQLEEESKDDRDYFVDRATIELLADRGAPPGLVDLLTTALGTDDGMDIAWRDGEALVETDRAEGPFR
jgi:hypothetical protein